MGRTVDVQQHPLEIRIFEEGQLIARHPVLTGKRQRRIDPKTDSLWHRKAPPVRKTGSGCDSMGSPLDRGVAGRPLAFYDAVARRMAVQEVR